MRIHGFLAFAVGICITVWVCLFVSEAQEHNLRSNFQRDTDKIARDTAVRLQTYFDMLLSIKGLYSVDEQVSRAKFSRYVQELKLSERYPGFQAIQFVRQVPASGLDDFAAGVRADASLVPGGYPKFSIHPAAARELHYIIEYNEPMAGNENAFGLDLGALPPHRRALELGRDSGQIVATERITLVQDSSGQPGFVARAPVYRPRMPLDTVEQRRAALAGFVAIVFRVNNLMREVVDTPLLAHMNIRINDAGYQQEGGATPPSLDNLMYDSAGKIGGGERQPALHGLTAQAALAVGERRWVMAFEGLAGARYGSGRARIALIAAAGTVISALIGLLLVTAQRRRELAEQLRKDIKVREQAEAALVETQHGLERSLDELAAQKANAELAHRDLTLVLATLKQAQANLITSEKMASLGALVAGIAHELNTPIGNSLLTATALSDMVGQFTKKLEDGGIKRSTLDTHLHDTRTACGIIAGSLGRAAELINSFKQVAVDQTSGLRRRFDLAGVVRDTLATYTAQLRRANCEVRVEVPDDLEFDSFPGSVSQVLSNLTSNAMLHAFDGRRHGIIRVRAEAVDDSHVLLEFRDDGLGMSPRTLHQIFDPFFTTKMGQGGSGLGMNIVYNIVTGVLRGTIAIQSEPGEGTSVTLVLPRVVPIKDVEREEEAAALPGAAR
ncbi:CHASE domain-containing protein [Pseudoduganella namucuonensis]|uniref:histidine kinase n=1 Tax=Pseudoduganella namucuonensis TaxID=1035707 RepID=A0A1I7FLQ3_9BURK|nr:CHASE domain-containing protein [Pseudoduganella namucuonensis]SFU37113.1 Histidine kinase-, DNA gyrase B-, and HSP90-like ATPase [Pseudoduganella namucuonensis]